MDIQRLDEICQRGLELYRSGDDAEAEALVRDELERSPSSLKLWGVLAETLLMQGRYREGWQAFEVRPSRSASELRGLSYPEWTGDPLGGRSILVCGEQGLGDEIMFSRFVPALRALGAGRITLACRGANLRAFQQFGADLVIARDGGSAAVPRHDCWVLLGSLPHRLGVTSETLDGAPYLQARPRRAGGVGVVEQGNPLFPQDANRSLPAGMLQEAIPHATLLQPEGDVQDSLERIAGLDLLVTVDTSWAHMAGALGVPCWVLLPAYAQDWRWRRGRRDSPWYRSIRLVRQGVDRQWASAVDEVVAALADRG